MWDYNTRSIEFSVLLCAFALFVFFYYFSTTKKTEDNPIIWIHQMTSWMWHSNWLNDIELLYCRSTHTILCSPFHMDMEITKMRMDISHMLSRRLWPKLSKFHSNPSFVACIQTLTHPSSCSLIRIMWRNRNENQNIDEVHSEHWNTRNAMMPTTYLFQCDILTECWLCCSIYIRNF